MSWTDRPNRALDRALGLQVVKTSSLNQMRAGAQRSGPLRQRLRRVQEELAQATQSAERKKARRYPPDLERDFCEIWDLVRDRTMTAHDKGYFLYQAVRYDSCAIRSRVRLSSAACGGADRCSACAHTLDRMSVSRTGTCTSLTPTPA